MENCIFKRINTQDNKPLRIHITLLQNSLEIILFQKENAWKSSVIKEDLKHFAEQYKLNLESYCEKLLEYVESADPDIIFIFTDDELIINRLLDNSLKVKFFTSKFKKVNYVEHVEQVMDKFYSEKLVTVEKLNTVIKEKDELDKHKSYCELKLKEVIQKRKTEEDEQFGQFVLILNEKKRRIQHLTELLEAFKNGRPTDNPVVKLKVQKSKIDNKNSVLVAKKETISDSESTDNENSSSGENSVKEFPPVEQETGPSTSAAQFDFLDDDFTPSHILPKRQKRISTTDVVVIAPPSQSNPKPKTEEVASTKRSKSPTIDLSTQQLLDML